MVQWSQIVRVTYEYTSPIKERPSCRESRLSDRRNAGKGLSYASMLIPGYTTRDIVGSLGMYVLNTRAVNLELNRMMSACPEKDSALTRAQISGLAGLTSGKILDEIHRKAIQWLQRYFFISWSVLNKWTFCKELVREVAVEYYTLMCATS